MAAAAVSSSSSSLLLAIICLLLSCPAGSASAIDVHQLCPNILTLSSLQASPPPNTTLRVLVPWGVGFDEFVKFRNDTCVLDGFSVRVFESALRYMPHPKVYQYVLFGDGKESPVYEDMVDLVQKKTVDAVVADLAITSERWDKVGFTVPYLASSLVMVTPSKNGNTGTYFELLQPFSWPLWGALLSAFVMTGLALYVLEYKNTDFSNTLVKTVAKDQGSVHGGSAMQGPTVMTNELATNNSLPVSPPHLPSQSTNIELTEQVSENTIQAPSLQEDLDTVPTHAIASLQGPVPAPPIDGQVSRKHRILDAYWFTSLGIFKAQQESVRTHLGRTVTFIWLFMMLILNSSYTASLSSIFSAEKIISTISFQELLGNTNISIGYQKGSFVETYMNTLNLQYHKLESFTSETQYAKALRDGKNLKPDGVGVVLDELPYTQFLLQFECDLTSSDTNNQLPDFGGFGFAFQKGDRLIQEFSEMILQMGEDGTLENLKNGWNVGETDRTGCGSDGEPSHLKLRSTRGFFAVVGFIYVFCLIPRACKWFMKAPKRASTSFRYITEQVRSSNKVHGENQYDQDPLQNRVTAQNRLPDDESQYDQDPE